MKTLTISTLAAAGLAAAACASGAGYAPRGDGRYGYAEEAVATDRYRVSYAGSPAATDDEVRDYALLRAAELTLQKGGDWFEVVDRDTDRDERGGDGALVVEHGYETTRSCGLLGCTEHVRPATRTAVGAGVGSGPEREHVTHTLEIHIGRGLAPQGAYDAQDVAETIRARL